MLKFRALKDKIITSKRNSQKLCEEQLLSFFDEQPSLSRLNYSLTTKLQAQINQITEHSYKIFHNKVVEENKKMNAGNSEKKKVRDKRQEKIECLRTQEIQGEDQNGATYNLDFQQTAKKGSNLTKSVIQGSNFTKIIDLMKEVNDLQKRKADFPKQSQYLRDQIKNKLAVVKILLKTIQDDSQKSLIDFYNQECENSNSPDSFHSQNSDETYQLQSDRQAYQFSQAKEHVDTNSTQEQEGNIQIKYRRLSPSNYQEESIYQMFYEEQEEDETSPECSGFEEKSSDKSIVHLFSYGKENGLDTPLSKITEKEQEYFSPQSKNSSLAASLEYKKIYYLLETSEKKSQLTYRKEISEFTPNNRSNISIQSNESKDRSRCHEQLGEMINLLETKYRRKIKIGVENLMDSLNLAIKDKSIKLRAKK